MLAAATIANMGCVNGINLPTVSPVACMLIAELIRPKKKGIQKATIMHSSELGTICRFVWKKLRAAIVTGRKATLVFLVSSERKFVPTEELVARATISAINMNPIAKEKVILLISINP